ncbi:hypothetical protein BDB00DRAFT_846020 [Zychaea mexicana]|uniref:uncharacterized protein n=1 Tax=Zychaea mexicana TaxID=64656 RepID=UPI0022FF099C|nr:uncharacterized protein BDB00DRAFT_846020 [Zychaea mexicana]KAI9488973.1 hypothetical protein BDB00DRAFT_846020 [Zychaea mexicana]
MTCFTAQTDIVLSLFPNSRNHVLFFSSVTKYNNGWYYNSHEANRVLYKISPLLPFFSLQISQPAPTLQVCDTIALVHPKYYTADVSSFNSKTTATTSED